MGNGTDHFQTEPRYQDASSQAEAECQKAQGQPQELMDGAFNRDTRKRVTGRSFKQCELGSCSTVPPYLQITARNCLLGHSSSNFCLRRYSGMSTKGRFNCRLRQSFGALISSKLMTNLGLPTVRIRAAKGESLAQRRVAEYRSAVPAFPALRDPNR